MSDQILHHTSTVAAHITTRVSQLAASPNPISAPGRTSRVGTGAAATPVTAECSSLHRAADGHRPPCSFGEQHSVPADGHRDDRAAMQHPQYM